MEIKLAQLEELLKLSKIEIDKLIAEKKIPVYLVEDEYRCNRAELKAWLLENNIMVDDRLLAFEDEARPISLTSLIARGGIFNNVAGRTAFEVIKNAVGLLTLPFELSRDKLILNFLEREELLPTAIGQGIALPHPREPLLTDPADQAVAICFLQQPIDFKALDGQKVHTMFVILSASQSAHLDILARLSFLCHDEHFVDLLRRRASRHEIFDYIIIREMEWNERRSKEILA